MNRYEIKVYKSYSGYCEVEAESEEQARAMYYDGEVYTDDEECIDDSIEEITLIEGEEMQEDIETNFSEKRKRLILVTEEKE